MTLTLVGWLELANSLDFESRSMFLILGFIRKLILH